jgi:hypothetical protein
MKKILKVKVTQADIANGTRFSDKTCPIALAIKRMGFKTVSVSCLFAVAGRTRYELCAEAMAFVGGFDHFVNVKPATFRLKEIGKL